MQAEWKPRRVSKAKMGEEGKVIPPAAGSLVGFRLTEKLSQRRKICIEPNGKTKLGPFEVHVFAPVWSAILPPIHAVPVNPDHSSILSLEQQFWP
jgi:hypothetical protein